MYIQTEYRYVSNSHYVSIEEVKMNRRHLALLISLILLLVSINLVAVGEYDSSVVVYVDDDNVNGPWDGSFEHPYQHIQDGIDNSDDMGIVFVRSGMYNESISIDKTIILVGENNKNTTIDGMYSNCIINITANAVRIMNFKIMNSGGYRENAGIKINSNDNLIERCTIFRTKIGIYIENSSSNKIENCDFHTNGEGIFVRGSYQNVIANCRFYHNAMGIHLQDAKVVKIIYSYLRTNGIGLFARNSSDIKIIHSGIHNNNDNQGGMFFLKCKYVYVSNSNFIHNGFGAHIENSSDFSFEQCDFRYNEHFAIVVSDFSKNINISNCEITNNIRYAIHTENSNLNVNENNIHKNMLHGLYAEKSICDARHNWWGLPTGPSKTSYGIADRISKNIIKVRYIPWSIWRIKDAGSNWEIEDYFGKIEYSNTYHKQIPLAPIW